MDRWGWHKLARPGSSVVLVTKGLREEDRGDLDWEKNVLKFGQTEVIATLICIILCTYLLPQARNFGHFPLLGADTYLIDPAEQTEVQSRLTPDAAFRPVQEFHSNKQEVGNGGSGSGAVCPGCSAGE